MTELITLNLTFEELKMIDKYVELNDDTQQLFDKIKNAYPQQRMTDFQPKPQTPEQVADGLRDAMRQAIKDGVIEEYGHLPDAFHLSDKEVEDLRKSKKELTEYGKQQLRKLMTEPIKAKVSDEDFQKIVEAFDNPQPYPDEMFEEAERREKLNAGFKQNENGEWYRPELKDLTRNERIELAEKEIAYIVMGGQDGREYADSIAFILIVLDSLRDKEDTEWKDSADGVA